jgi:Domain of unknown function (DUF4136)
MTKFLNCAAAVVALATLTSPVPAQAKVEIVETASPALAKGSSFAWAATPAVGFGIPDPAIANEITAERLRVNTEAALAAKGYRQVGSPAEADFLVSYTIVMVPTSDAELSASGCNSPVCDVPSNVSLDTKIHTDGLLVLDLTERRTGRLIWRATSKKRVTGKDASDKSLTSLLRQMTKSLPQ